jgi:FkbM family methyltransferase
MSKVHYALTAWGPYRRLSRLLIRRIRAVFGCPEPWGVLISFLKAHPDSVYLDIGAFDGATIQRIRDECPNTIHAFEPTPESFTRLEARWGKDPKVHLWNIALGAESGKLVFHINANKQTNSLLANDLGNVRYVGDMTKPECSVEVEGKSLDEWGDHNLPPGTLFVAKCDVQGAEGLVIKGGARIIAEQCLAFYSEVQLEPMYQGQASFADIHNTLCKNLGMALHEIYPCLRDGSGRALQTDALWIRAS